MSLCPHGRHPFPIEDATGAHCEEHGVTLLWHSAQPEQVEMVPVMCPHCRTAMAPAGPDRWNCATCPRTAQPGDTPAAIEQREASRLEALALLDVALGPRAVERESDKEILAEMETTMGQTIQTRGCGKCGGTMYKTVETDDNGNPTNESMFICTNCGNME